MTRLALSLTLAAVMMLAFGPPTALALDPANPGADKKAPGATTDAPSADADTQPTLHRYLQWYLDMKERRARHIRRLAEYRDAGEFPRNTYQPGLTPVFVDADGVACAMGWLMLRDGQKDLVEHVVKADNLLRLDNLDPASELGREVMAWLDANGLTLAEAARVQPSYEWRNPPRRQPLPEPEPEPQPQPADRAVEIIKLKKHFREVIGELEAATDASLKAILDRRIAVETDDVRAGAVLHLMRANDDAVVNAGDRPMQVWMLPIAVTAADARPAERWTSRIRHGSAFVLPPGVSLALVVTQPIEN
ncbi:MAG: hypothetical protein AB7K09_22845 [Planctomycetota bacterium]